MTSSKAASAKPDAGISRKYRVTLSLPAEVNVLLTETAKNMGMTKSALVSSLLLPTLPHLHRLTRSKPTPETAKRFRGESIDTILKSVATILKEI